MNQKIKINWNNKIIHLLAFLITVLILNIVCMINSIAPFGNNTFIVVDMQGQYIDYLSYFKSVIASNNDFFYTFSKNLGGDMIGFAAYYLLSPLNLLLFLFPDNLLTTAISLLIILKLSLCAVTFSVMLRQFDEKFGFKSLIFSLSYALMGYTTIYCWNIMWLDGIILLPLVIAGIHRIITLKKPMLYIVSLMGALITNYYIGFMICIFSVIYFLYRVIKDYHDIKRFGNTVFKYAFSSVLAGGLSAVILIPTFLALGGGKASFSLSDLTFQANFDFTDIFSKFFPGASDLNQVYDGLPNIFCGMLIIILTVLFFFNKNISIREKLASAGVFVILFLSFYINAFNMIWHGFNAPTGFPYRYSFIFTFFMIYVSYRCFQNFKSGIKGRHLIFSLLIIFFILLITVRKEYSYLSFKIICYFFILLFALVLLLYLFIKFKGKSVYLILSFIMIFHFGDLFLNTEKTFAYYKTWDPFTKNEYSDYYSLVKKAVNKIKETDKTFYRMEKTFKRSHNDPMQFDYAGLSHFSSSEKTFVKDFMGQMGFKNNGNWAYYNRGSTASADCLLGVKYLLSYDTFPELEKGFDKLFIEDSVIAYKNPMALPLGFSVSNESVNTTVQNGNIFEIQNSVYKSMAPNIGKDIFTAAIFEKLPITNLKESEINGMKQYDVIDGNSESFVNYKITITSEDTLYMFIPSTGLQNAEIFVNGISYGQYFDIYQWNVMSLGKFKKGDIVEFSVKLKDSSLVMGQPQFYYENLNILKEYTDLLSEQGCDLEKISSSHLKGTVNTKNDNQLLIFSIPCEKGWKITVDGKKAENIMLFDALMAVKVDTAGQHVVEMRYIPDGFYLGACVSAVSLIVLILWMIIINKKNKERL